MLKSESKWLVYSPEITKYIMMVLIIVKFRRFCEGGKYLPVKLIFLRQT